MRSSRQCGQPAAIRRPVTFRASTTRKSAMRYALSSSGRTANAHRATTSGNLPQHRAAPRFRNSRLMNRAHLPYAPMNLRNPDRLCYIFTTMKPSDALAAHRGELRELVTRHGLARAHLRFGSTGKDDEESDLDLLVDPTETTSLLPSLASRRRPRSCWVCPLPSSPPKRCR